MLHRRTGFAIVIFLVNLAITGILLNHSEELELHQRFVKSEWILKWYGFKPPQDTICFKVQSTNQNVCQIGKMIFRENQLLLTNTSPIISLLKVEGLIYLATSEELNIYTESFELVESLNRNSSLPTPVETLSLYTLAMRDSGSKQETIAVSTSNKVWALEQNEFRWIEQPNTVLFPNQAKNDLIELPPNQLVGLQTRYLENQLTQLKFIQDLHSGSIIAGAGKWIIDLVGILVIALAITGFLAWQRRNRKNRLDAVDNT
ncbi:MAG: PepSY domain-containing protein [Kangiellaceae bacterium]|nr:PepSY domain-containing protein [Kangiellaceae bacterium]